MTSTYYVIALDFRGNTVGMYVEALNLDEAWLKAESKKAVVAVQAIQLVFSEPLKAA